MRSLSARRQDHRGGKATGAEAIHPGYGFLSENADFAQAVIDAGLIWVGPKPDSIRAMGLKDAAKKLMAEAGVPVTPGYLGEDQDPKRLKKEAGAIGYPVLIKAVAGGGGKGMRKVERAEDFDDALESCKREAASAFGDDVVLLEKWIESPRHIEVQVFGDSHGNVVHLFERDCSLQRRHQKVIEEAPAPGMDAETREAVCGAAVRAAQAVNYENAGTIEFIADASEGLRADRIWFMEMNTRLQVEHPVTEEITGQDLVEWQLRVASGEKLPKTQDELTISGHAIEARLYAEDPAKGFLPSVGELHKLYIAAPPEYAVRFDMGFETGDAVSPHYDPMLGKLIASGKDRAKAVEALAWACRWTTVWPVRTNLGFVLRCLEDRRFQNGEVDTGFIERNLDALTRPSLPVDAMAAYAADEIVAVNSRPSPLRKGFRLNAEPRARIELIDDQGDRYDVDLVRGAGQGFGGFDVERGYVIWDEGEYRAFRIFEPRNTGTTHSAHDGEIEAPMPGRVTAVEVSLGENVAIGQRLLTLEAMKMEHALTAPFDGTVAELNATPGAQVSEGQLLVKVKPDEKADPASGSE